MSPLFKALTKRLITTAASNASPLAGQKTSGTGAGFLGRALPKPVPARRAFIERNRLYKTKAQPVRRSAGLIDQLLKLLKG